MAPEPHAPLHVVVADPVDITALGVVGMLQAQGIPVARRVAALAELRSALRTTPAGARVALVDVRLAALPDVLDAIRVAASGGWVAIAMGVEAPPEVVLSALRAGAAGYVTKDLPASSWASAVRAAARGEILLSRALTSLVVAQLRSTEAPSEDASLVPSDRRLTRREWEILAQIAQGHTNRAVAHQLCISIETVRSHVSSILAKLDAPNRSAAAARYHALRAVYAG